MRLKRCEAQAWQSLKDTGEDRYRGNQGSSAGPASEVRHVRTFFSRDVEVRFLGKSSSHFPSLIDTAIVLDLELLREIEKMGGISSRSTCDEPS